MISAGVAYGLAAITATSLLIAGVAVATPADESGTESAASTTTERSATSTVAPPVASDATVPPPTPVVVPALAGMGPTEAITALRDLGLVVRSSEVPALVSYAIDVVVATEPPEGTPLVAGDSLNVVVGRQPEANLVERATPLPWDSVEWVDSVDRTVGRCGVGRLDGVGLILDAVDCLQPHDFQFVQEIPIETSPDENPNLVDEVFDMCAQFFESFVGVPYERSALYITTLTPDAAGWNLGSRTAECLIRSPDWGLQIVGDAAGSLW